MVPYRKRGIGAMVAAGLLLVGPSGAEAGAAGRRPARVHASLLTEPAPLNSSASDALRTRIAAALDLGGLRYADGDDGGGKQPAQQYPQQQGITAQVAEKDVKSLRKQLSSKCGDRFNDQMEGKGPKMHSFRSTGGAKDGPQCEKLKGHLCYTKANMQEGSTNSSGRTMVKQLKVEGNSCIPEECTGQKDLTALAEFKLKVVEDLISNHKMDAVLHIDCSGAGGAVASCGGPEEAKPISRAASTALAATAALVMAVALGLA